MDIVTTILTKEKSEHVDSPEEKVFTTFQSTPDEKAQLEDVVDDRLESDMRALADATATRAAARESEPTLVKSRGAGLPHPEGEDVVGLEQEESDEDESSSASAAAVGDETGAVEGVESEAEAAPGIGPEYGLMHVVGNGIKLTARNLRPETRSLLLLPWRLTTYYFEGVGAIVEATGDVKTPRDALRLVMRFPVRLGARLVDIARKPLTRTTQATA